MSVRIIIPGKSYTGRPNVVAPLPSFGGALYAAYFIGTDYQRGPGYDWSGNGRTANTTSATIGAKSLAAGTSSKLVLPFTGTTIAAVTGSVHVAAVAKVPTTSRIMLSSNLDGTNRSFSLGVLDTTNGSAFTVDAGTSNSTITGGVDADRATRFEMYTSRHQPTATQVSRRWAGGTLVKAAEQTASRVVGGGTIQIGAPLVGTTYGGPAEIVSCFYFSRALTDLELEELYTATSTFLAQFSVAL